MNCSNFYIISFSFHSVKSFFDLFYSIVVIVLRPAIQINKCSFHHLSKWYLLLCYKQCNFYKISHFYIHVNTFCQKIKSSYLEDLISAEGGIWTLAPRKRSTPLAGAPLQPLEYFSWISNSSDIVLTSLWRSFIIINSFWNVNWFFAFSLFIFSGLTCKVKFTFFNSPILLPCIQYVCILIWTQRNACRSHLTSDIKIWTIPSWI